MVFCKVRETYDLHTIKNKMSCIAIHTPKPDIIKRNFPGLLMQCKTYRPYSCDVRLACASVLPVDPLGVGLGEGDVAPEDLFNPILYKATTNIGMSQLEARMQVLSQTPSVGGQDVDGQSAAIDVDSLTNISDEFQVYYGLLSNAYGWKHANPQQGLEMRGLRPLVFEVLASVGDQNSLSVTAAQPYAAPLPDGTVAVSAPNFIRGNGKPLPMINCTSYSQYGQQNPFTPDGGSAPSPDLPKFREQDVPWINCMCGVIIVPPSRLHELFYRMVVEWTIEFSDIRPFSEVVGWSGLEAFGRNTHYQNYSYETAKALAGVEEDHLTSDQNMVSANVDVKKVM